jgi:hypothetical protein
MKLWEPRTKKTNGGLLEFFIDLIHLSLRIFGIMLDLKIKMPSMMSGFAVKLIEYDTLIPESIS